MATAVRTHTRVEARTYARSATYVANELLRVQLEIVRHRALPLDYLHSNHEKIMNGFRTWIAGRWLKAAVLEIWDTGTDKLVERYDLCLSYESEVGEERYDTKVALLEELATLPPLPSGCKYRLVVDLEVGSPDLPGWTPTTFRDNTQLKRKDVGDVIDTARIGVRFTRWF